METTVKDVMTTQVVAVRRVLHEFLEDPVVAAPLF